MARQARRRRSSGWLDWRARSGDVCDVEVDAEMGEARVLRARIVSGRPGAEGAERVVVVCDWGCAGDGAMRSVFD